MAITARRGVGEAVGSAFCFLAVIAALVAIDERVRDRMSLLFAEAATDRVGSWGHRASSLADVIVQAARDQSIAHAPLVIFAMVAVVLVIFMLRT